MEQLAHTTGRDRVRQNLRAAILSGELRAGQKLLPTEAISKRYGVSPRTAHEALRDLVNEKLIVREKGRGTFVGNLPTDNQEATEVVAIMLPPSGHVWSEMVANLAGDLQTAGYRTELISPQAEPNGETPDCTRLESTLALAPKAIICRQLWAAKWLSSACPGANIICVRSVEDRSFTGSIVAPDTYAAAYTGTHHLAQRGARRIGLCTNMYISTQPWILEETDLALAGFRQALAEAGAEEGPLLFASELDSEGTTIDSALRNLELPDAFHCTTDFRASQLVDALRGMGKSVPGDVAIVGTHNTPWAHAYQLTSVESHWERVARECIQIICQGPERPTNIRRHSYVQPDIVIRRSCHLHESQTPESR